jgi:nitrogen fixation protein
MQQDGFTIREVSHNFTATPTVNDDITKGFVIGSRWILDNGDVYVCSDETASAAVWALQVASVPTLQQVTDEGSITTNMITVGDTAGIYSEVADSYVGTANEANDTYAYIGNDGSLGLGNGAHESNLKNTNATTTGIILEFPNKAAGSYTIATTGDIPSISGLVPYTGATQNVDLGTYNLIADQVALNVTPNGTLAVGATEWNNTLGSSQTLLKGGSVTLKNGVDLVARVVNKVSPNTTLTKAAYQVVKVSGAQGQRLAVNLAQANNDNNSADTLGVVTETIAANQEGFIMTVGQLEGINTTGSLQGETWADGDVLYLSPTVAGRITNVKPTGATGHIVIIGYVEYAHANNGKIYVKIMNGWELDELHNVYINTGTLANNDALIYESSTQLWKNKTIATALGFTPENVANKQNSLVVDGTGAKYPTVDAINNSGFSKISLVGKFSGASAITSTNPFQDYFMQSVLIPANTFANGDVLKFSVLAAKNATGSTSRQIKANIDTTSGTITGVLIANYQSASSGNQYLTPLDRRFSVQSNGLSGLLGFVSAITDLSAIAGANSTGSITSINWTIDNYLNIVFQSSSLSPSILTLYTIELWRVR